jgi:hypothetical protein
MKFIVYKKEDENIDLYIANFENVSGDEKVKFRPT